MSILWHCCKLLSKQISVCWQLIAYVCSSSFSWCLLESKGIKTLSPLCVPLVRIYLCMLQLKTRCTSVVMAMSVYSLSLLWSRSVSDQSRFIALERIFKLCSACFLYKSFSNTALQAAYHTELSTDQCLNSADLRQIVAVQMIQMMVMMPIKLEPECTLRVSSYVNLHCDMRWWWLSCVDKQTNG